MDGSEYDARTGEIEAPQRNPLMAQGGERNLIFASAECGEVFGALSEAQGKMENPKKTKTASVQGQTKNGGTYKYDYAYAPLDEIMNVIRVPLAAAGLVHRQFLAQRDGAWIMRTIIAHRSGQWYGCDYPIFAGRQEGAQGFASGVTYARRYGLMMALGLVGEDDDDANVADGKPAEIASGARTAPGSAGAARSAPARQQAAPAPSAAKAEADKRYTEIRSEIDAAMTVPDLDAIPAMPAWDALKGWIVKAEVEKGAADSAAAMVAETAMGALTIRIDKRKAMLTGDDGGYR